MNCYRINDIENFVTAVPIGAMTTKPMAPSLVTTKPMTVPPKAKILGITSTINNNIITDVSYVFDPSSSFTMTQMPKILTADVKNSLTNYKNFINANNGFVLVNLNLDSIKSFTDMIITESLKENGIWSWNVAGGKPIPATDEDISKATKRSDLQLSEMSNLILSMGTLSGLYTMVTNKNSTSNTIQILFPNALIKNNLNFISIIRTLHDALETSLKNLGNNSMELPSDIKDIITVVLKGFLTGLNQNTSHPEIRFANSANLLVQIGILFSLYNLPNMYPVKGKFLFQTFPPLIASVLSKMSASLSDTQCNSDNNISFTPNICNPVQKFKNTENFENTDISTWMVLIIVLLLVILFLKCTA